MPYPTPTLTTLQQQALQDIQAAQITNGSGITITGLLQKAILRVLALVLAGFCYLLFDFLRYIALQSTPWGATDENAAAWGALKDVYQEDAIASVGAWTSGVSTNGKQIPVGSLINRYDGAIFISTATVSVSGGVAVVPVQAVVAGAASTINVGDSGSLAAPITGINGLGSFTAVTTAGADQETQDHFKSRYLAAYAAPSQGGAFTDYIEWATAVPGVTRAWCIANYNSITAEAAAGCVTVLFMMDGTEASHGGFPQGTNGCAPGDARNTGSSSPFPVATGDQLTVANAIFPLRPVTAMVLATAPGNNAVNFTIQGLITTIPAATQALVEAALQQMFLSVATPSGTTRPDGGTGGDLYPSDWEVAISEVPDMPPFLVASPTSTVTSSTGAMPTLGTVTFE
jgi:uncharacterized phage protein gp47/JayE